jgi:guanine nucleotide-binding protein subunit alpha
MNHQGLSIYSFWVDLDSSDNQHLYTALKNTLSQIQQRNAKEEAWNSSVSATTDSDRPSTNGLSSVLNPSKSRGELRKREEKDRARIVTLM